MPVLLALFALLLSMFTPAHAEVDIRGKEIPKWYGALGGGMVFLQDYTTKFNNDVGVFAAPSIKFKPGFALRALAGYRINPFLSTDLEIAHYRNGVSSITNTSGGGLNIAPQKSSTVMANGYLHYPNQSLFTPYAGAGLGAVYLDVPLIATTPDGETQRFRDWVFGYQFMAGVSYEMPPGMTEFKSEIVFGYRYLHSDPGEIRFATIPYGYGIELQNESQSVDLMWRFYF